jgi:HK97 family phage prohead protease
MDDEAIRREADRLYWRRCRPLLVGPPVDPVTLARLYEECLAEATRTAALDTTQDSLGLLVAKLVGVTLETKDLPGGWWQQKDGDTADSTVNGYLAVFNNEDLVKDVIHEGAFRTTLREAKAFASAHQTDALYPLLWQHDAKDPIGGIYQASEDRHGLRVACRINTTVEHGRQAYDGLRNKYLSFSIGYKPIRYEWKGNIRHLHEIALAEGSVVTFPANREARPAA